MVSLINYWLRWMRHYWLTLPLFPSTLVAMRLLWRKGFRIYTVHWKTFIAYTNDNQPRFKDLCAACGRDLRIEREKQKKKNLESNIRPEPRAENANLRAVHNIPELLISSNVAENVAQDEINRKRYNFIRMTHTCTIHNILYNMTLWWPIFYRLKGCTRFVNWFFWLIWIRRLSIQLKTVLQNSTNIQFRFNSTKMSLGFGQDFGKILKFRSFTNL